MKRISWLSFLFILGLAACQPFLGSATTPSPVPPGAPPAPATAPAPAATPTATIAPPTATPAKPLMLIRKTLSDELKTPPYKINLNYPEIAEASGSGPLAFNQEAKKMAEDLLAFYQKEFKGLAGVPELSGVSSTADLNYTVTHGEHGLLSIRFVLSYYFAGAAHPNSGTLGMNFDLIAGKRLELAQLFQPGSDYLKAIADYCVADLQKQDRLTFPEGALPKPENYQNWNIAPTGLLISFDPYQVGPYAMGPSQVTIPYATLKGILKTDGPLAVLIR